MGNCCVSQAPPITDNIEYHEQITINIKEKDIKGKTIRVDSVPFKISSPSSQLNEVYSLNKQSFTLSSCILPGLDPRNLINKDCQDGCVSIFHESTLLLALFDGHGKEGQRVAQFCISFMRDFFISQHSLFLSDTEEAILRLIQDCDDALRQKSSKIDSSLSGTTAVVVFITEEGMHVASVGDSRAVLATIPNDNQSIGPVEHSSNPYVRKLEPTRALAAVSMTVDQKPNHQAELERIERSGGKVQQLTDDFGNKVGPFRVWQKNGILPGLAMSRSIGDTVAKEIGVIAEPIYHFFPHFHYRDQFLVMASDGVWDVMENLEVVNFVERFRKKCLKKHGPRAYPHRVQNSTISHFLAEEARYRWFGVCEDEDVMIDDISVIVLELGCLEPEPGDLPPVTVNRHTLEFKSVAISKEDKAVVPGVMRGDALRGSFIPGKDPNAKKPRFDPKRGSYANKDEKTAEDEEDVNLDGIPFTK